MFLRKFIIPAAIVLTASLAAAQSTDLPEVAAEIEYAREACRSLGTFELVPDRIVKELPDLNGDGRAEIAVDHAGFVCHGAYSIYGGSAGTPLVVLITSPGGYLRFRFRARSWRVVAWPGERGAKSILVLSLHGTDCGGVGADPCFEALTWSGGRLLAVKPR